MAWTQTDLEILEEAIARGELRVRFRDHEVQYRSMDELLKARSVIAAHLNPAKPKYLNTKRGT